MSLADLIEAIEGRRSLPDRPVLITFDDGYRGVLTHALPVLERYRLPAAVFITTDPVANGEHFWFDAVFRESGEAAVRDAQRSMPEWRAVTARFRRRAEPTSAMAPLTIDELQTLAAHPLIDIGAHTRSHVMLQIASASQQEDEIAGSRAQLESWLGRPVRAFAYPYGMPDVDYSSEAVASVVAAGYQCAFSTRPAFATASGDRWQLPRFTMLHSIDQAELFHRMTHSWHRVE